MRTMMCTLILEPRTPETGLSAAHMFPVASGGGGAGYIIGSFLSSHACVSLSKGCLRQAPAAIQSSCLGGGLGSLAGKPANM